VTASPKRAADTRAEDLPKAWDPGTAESATYQRWVDAGYFTADPAGTKRGYSIVLPPPNVTGSLRMGHALEHTMMDALTRRKRMQGYEVLWQPGMDHAGIATTAVLAAAVAAPGDLVRHRDAVEEPTGGESVVIAEWPQTSGIALNNAAAQRIPEAVVDKQRERQRVACEEADRITARLAGLQ
jgi:valyl-tRNA synthetase